MCVPESELEGIVWPAIPNRAAAILMALQFQLQQSQWWSTERLRRWQFEQLSHLLRHAQDTVPYYRQRLAEWDFTAPLDDTRWQQLPLLSRNAIEQAHDDLLSDALPPSHGRTLQKKTSGSTGRGLSITDTDANRLYWMAITLRDHLWHKRDLSGTLVSIRSGRSAEDPNRVVDGRSWGPSTARVFATGPGTVFYHLMPIERQAEIILNRQPQYLLMYPSNAIRLADYFQRHQLSLPSLKQVMTYGELVPDELATACEKAWGVGVADMYSCEELGYIALQCPETGLYHCQSESLLVEVLDSQGQPCRAGEIGRLALTSLHNFAMPMVRYVNDDFAMVGPPCPCGRGGMTLQKILGRARNQATRPDGTRFWPSITRQIWRDLPHVETLQLVQQTPDQVLVRVISGRTTTVDEQQILTRSLQQHLDANWRFSFQDQTRLVRHENGKFERFMNCIPA